MEDVKKIKNDHRSDWLHPKAVLTPVAERIVQALSLQYYLDEYYLYHGNAPADSYIQFNITTVVYQYEAMISLVLPVLIEQQIYFRVAKDITVVKYILNGIFGQEELGKVLTFFVPGDKDINGLTDRLSQLTSAFNGPRIPGELQLSSIIYTPEEKNSELQNDVTPEFNFPQKLNEIYNILKTLKVDVKGSVFLSAYSRHGQVYECVIKEGKAWMWSDEYGRDITHCIHAQYNTHLKLQDKVYVPPAIDLFKDGDNTYMVTAFINGMPLSLKIPEIYQDRMWFDLLPAERLELLSLLRSVIEIVIKFHENGIVHRDLTPVNFILNTDGNLYAIDLELAYDETTQMNVSPFCGGTTGFMSPQQIDNLQPHRADDVYGLCALMIVFFTNLPPVKFFEIKGRELARCLTHFIQDDAIANIIASGLSHPWEDRPAIHEVLSAIEKKIELERSSPRSVYRLDDQRSSAEIIRVINDGIAGLGLQRFDQGTDLLCSYVDTGTNNLKNMVMEGGGLSVPLNGLLILDTLIHHDFSNALRKIVAPRMHLYQKEFSRRLNTLPPGLFTGKAGGAMAIASAIKQGLIESDENSENLLTDCFTALATNLDLASGCTGQALALMFCGHLLGEDYKEILAAVVQSVLNQRISDGTWNLTIERNGKIYKALGLAYGIAGIAYFLIHFYRAYPEPEIGVAIQEVLLSIESILELQQCKYPDTGMVNDWSLLNGAAGIALLFIKAYEVFKKNRDKETAEIFLLKIPDRANVADYSIAFGMSGWGVTYLEAYNAFPDKRWLDRAGWIAEIYLNTANYIDDKAFWNTDGVNNADASILHGTAGIIYFLTRYYQAIELSKET